MGPDADFYVYFNAFQREYDSMTLTKSEILGQKDNHVFLKELMYILNDLDCSSIKFLTFHSQRILVMYCQQLHADTFWAFGVPESNGGSDSASN